LLMLDARSMRFETLTYEWDPSNPLTGKQATENGRQRTEDK
jgi:adenylyltransferase/sulfurtransferase